MFFLNIKKFYYLLPFFWFGFLCISFYTDQKIEGFWVFSLWSFFLALVVFLPLLAEKRPDFWFLFKKGIRYGLIYSLIVLVMIAVFFLFLAPDLLSSFQQERLALVQTWPIFLEKNAQDQILFLENMKEHLAFFFGFKTFFPLILLSHLLFVFLYSLLSAGMLKIFFQKNLEIKKK